MRRCTHHALFWILLALCPQLGRATDGAPPQRILILGDSMMRIPVSALENEFTKHTGVEVRPFTALGTGLARLDVLDWMDRIERLVASFQPDAAVMFIGANDRQPMRVKEGVVIRPEQDGWEEEYARRVGQAMDLLGAAGAVRVFWLELPDMKDGHLHENANLINAIFEREAGKRPFVTLFRTRPILTRKPGVFTLYVINERGLPLSVRDRDGVHLSRGGAELLASALAESLWPDNPDAP
ncbi:MAG: DUF459 domain-containing protein [Candidatus Marinimicrobia bacterium]|nr:DUF459 domain-containing protein [Candidatus Neomarinimicrobiota bacterium]